MSVNAGQLIESRKNAVLVVGLGKTGYSAIQHFCEEGHSVVAVDTRQGTPYLSRVRDEFPDVQIHCGAFEEDMFRGFETVLVSPGVPLEDPAIQCALKCGADVIGDVELFARNNDRPVIAITGSNGKSTVTQLVGDMLNAAGINALVGGNLGVPALELLRHALPDVYVLELSSFQLEATRSLEPVSAVVLNISEDHMDRYPTLEAYRQAKASIYRHCSGCVVNRDDPGAGPDESASCHHQVTFGNGAPANDSEFGFADALGETWIFQGKTALMRCSETELTGRHNLLNIQAAMALITAAGYDLDRDMLDVVGGFAGLSHRMQTVVVSQGVRWINDSKGTNVGATSAALEGLSEPVILIAGGQGKDADFEPLAVASQERVRSALVFGEDGHKISNALSEACPVQVVQDLRQAVQSAQAMATSGDVVLFSPACASFDMFANFEARGNAFCDLVYEVTQCRQ